MGFCRICYRRLPVGVSPTLHILHSRNDAGYMQLVRVNASTFDWIVSGLVRNSPASRWFEHRTDAAACGRRWSFDSGKQAVEEGDIRFPEARSDCVP